MKKYRFLSKFDCVIEVLNQECFLGENEFLEMEMEENFLVKIFPVGKKRDCYSLAYAMRVCDFKHINFGDFELLLIKERLIGLKDYLLLEYENEKCKFELHSFPHRICVKYAGKNYNFDIKEELVEYKFENNYLLAKSEEKMHLCIFHKQTKTFSYFCASDIEVNQNKIISTDILNDIAKHCEKKIFSFDSSNYTLESSELFYIKGEPKLTYNQELIPLAFLEAVKCADYKLARKYLFEPLKARLTDNHLKAFFKDIENIIPVDDKFAILDSFDNYEIYTFEFENNLISNIKSI